MHVPRPRRIKCCSVMNPPVKSNVPDTDMERNCHLCQQQKFCKHSLAMNTVRRGMGRGEYSGAGNEDTSAVLTGERLFCSRKLLKLFFLFFA